MKGLKEMKKSIKTALAGLMILPALALGVALFVPSAPSYAADTLTIGGGASAAQDAQQPSSLPDQFKNIVNIALYVIGAVSVLMLIYGGIRYTISGGDTAAVTAAKNTILYAIIGIVIALLAYAIVNFVIGRFATN
jgi:hypothetical protein